MAKRRKPRKKHKINKKRQYVKQREASWHAQGIEITFEEYQKMLIDQNGVCAICKHPPKKRALNVDHNHKTGAVRGLLCFWCNKHLIGGRNESIELHLAAAEYLRKYKEA